MLAFGLIVVFIVFVYAVSRTLKSGDTPRPAVQATTPVTQRPVILPAAPPVAKVDRYSLTPQEQQLVDKHKDLFDRNRKVDIAGITIAPSRRTIMEQLAPYQFLVLRREHDNLYDRNAIKVKVGGNHVLGWVPRAIAKDIAADLDAGRIWMAMYPHAMRDDGVAPIATMILLRVTEELAVQLNPDHRPVMRTAINMDTANKIVVKLGETKTNKPPHRAATSTARDLEIAGGAR